MDRLDSRQVVPLTAADLELLRDAASTHAITPGLCARALLRWALDHLTGDALEAAVAQERTEATARTSAGARRAVAQRWGTA